MDEYLSRLRIILTILFCLIFSTCLISFNEEEIKPPKVSSSAVKKSATYNLLDYSAAPFFWISSFTNDLKTQMDSVMEQFQKDAKTSW